MKNVLIAGSAGFLGSHLAMKHLSQGDLVFGLDNFSSSSPSSKHHSKIQNENKNYFFRRHDITKDNLHELFENKHWDVIYSFACPASPPRYQEIPVETMMTCVLGTKNLLDLASEKTVVVHASTSEVYGDPSISPQKESYRGNVNSYGPRSCYDEGKRAAEALCFDYANKYGIDVRLVRIFNTYGPHMDIRDGRVITNFIDQALQGKPLTVYGDGSQTRSFCYVDDLIDGITKLASLEKNPQIPINIGNPHEFTIMQLAEKLQSLFSVKIEYLPLPIDDPLQRKPDITLAQNVLEWNPKIQLSEGLDRTIEYFKKL